MAPATGVGSPVSSTLDFQPGEPPWHSDFRRCHRSVTFMTPDCLQQFEDLYHSAPGSIPIAQFCSLLSGTKLADRNRRIVFGGTTVRAIERACARHLPGRRGSHGLDLVMLQGRLHQAMPPSPQISVAERQTVAHHGLQVHGGTFHDVIVGICLQDVTDNGRSTRRHLRAGGKPF
jgi:hypothetical protein